LSCGVYAKISASVSVTWGNACTATVPVPSDAADVAIAAGVRCAVDLDAFRNTVDHPVLGNPARGVESELGRSVVGEGAFGDLDQQERVLRVGFAPLVGHWAAPDDGDVRLGLGVVAESDGTLDRHDGAAGQAHGQELVQIVAEGVVPSAYGRHLDDLAPDQLDPVSRLEDAHLAHPVVLLTGEESSCRRHLDRHRCPSLEGYV